MITERYKDNMKSLYVPTEFFQFAFKNRLLKEAELLIVLKFKFNDITKLKKEDIEYITTELGYKHAKSVKNLLKQLISLNWIGYNFNTKNYFIRSFNSIRKSLNLRRRLNAEFSYEFLKVFKIFGAAAVMKSLNIEYRRKLTFSKAEETRGSSFHALEMSTPISNEALSKILGVSLTAAHELKAEAKKLGFISVKKQVKKIVIKSSDLLPFKMHCPDLYKGAFCIGNNIYWRCIDKVESFIPTKRRSKLSQL
jgi:hypothetical protein